MHIIQNSRNICLSKISFLQFGSYHQSIPMDVGSWEEAGDRNCFLIFVDLLLHSQQQQQSTKLVLIKTTFWIDWIPFIDCIAQQNSISNYKKFHSLLFKEMDAKLKQFISRVKKEHDDDAVDRCIYANTVYILGFFAVSWMNTKRPISWFW